MINLPLNAITDNNNTASNYIFETLKYDYHHMDNLENVDYSQPDWIHFNQRNLSFIG